MVLETSLQPCLCHTWFIILENFHLWTLWDWAVLGDCGEMKGKGEHCSMAVLGCAGTVAMAELGPGIVGAQLVLENRRGQEDTDTGASPALDQLPQATRCQTQQGHVGLTRDMGSQRKNFWSSSTLGLPCHKPSSSCLEAGPLYCSWCKGGSAPVSM